METRHQQVLIGFLLLGTAGAALAQGNSDSSKIRVILLGTAGGPPVTLGRAGISTLIEAGGDRFLFDAGRGFMERLVRAGLPMDAVTKLFISHLHSDHIVDVSDLMLMPWSIPSGRRTPLEVWGPQGTREMMRHLQAAFRFDIHIRRDVDEKLPSDGIKVISHDIREGTVYEKNGVKVRAFIVDHGPVKPAYGYRLDYAGRSIALSGDTRPTDNLVKHCQGVDVLIHEAVDPETLRRLNAPEELFRAIVAHHTTPEQAGEIFSRVRPKLAVFSHYNTASVLGRAKETYSGRIELGDDLMVIDIADDVTVTRRQ